MKTKYIDMTMQNYANELASNKSMPGGGSAAAYALTLANSLASMVANFTTGKKKYLKYENDIQKILKRTDELSLEIISMVDEDAEAFLPLAAAYKMPKETDEQKILKDIEMQKCLKVASMVPINTIRKCSQVLDIHEELSTKGSKMLISDVGVGVQMVKSAALSAKINVLINIKDIKDCEFVDNISKEMNKLLEDICQRCDKIYSEVLEDVR
ncbi:MAG: cyclodeaminase/cyclohydrolase family protein [Peptostreptococcus sp.]|uniref:cyclodeaminase/cyclohydrolase family protein n=1 Tax=Peptostreptococcus sp. TaxID=1262 RepID=UPI002FCB466F